MGGTQSQYMCDEHVAAHIKSRPFLEQELNSCVQGKAKLASFDVVDGNGVISYTLENGATVVECKSKLDEFFKKFMTFSESYDPQKIPFHLSSHMLHAGVDCTVKWDNPNHSVQITGNKNDVKEVIKKLREYQNPTLPPAVSTAPPPPTVTVNNNLPPKSFGFTYPLAQFQTTSVQPNTTTSSVTTANAPSNAPINPLPTPSPPSGPSTSSSAHQPPETFTYDIEIGQPPRTPTPDPLTEFVMVAPQFAVARFIKYSREERSRMETCLYKTGDVEIVENAEKKLEYIIRPRQYLVLPKTQKEYEKKCRKELLAYLDNYSSYFCKFNREVLHSAMERNPFYFNDRSPRENRIVFVRWYMDDCKVLVAGPKQKVENELDRIYSVLQIPRPENLTTFELYIENPEIAQFIESSEYYRELLFKTFEETATVNIVRKQRNIAFKFRSIYEVDEDEVEMFKDNCKQVLNEFTSQFSHWSSKYPANQIQKAKRQSSSAFTCTQDVTVKVDNSYLSIIGLNEIVEGRKEEMLKAMQMARKKILSHRCPAKDYHVAEFINQRSARMNELKQSFSRIATLKIVAKGKDKLEYQFTSNEEMLPEDQTQFKSECLVKLNKFLVKYTSWEKTYPPSVLKMAAMNNDPYLQSIAGHRLERFLHENKFVLVGVKSCVENMKTEISNMMEHYQREHQRLTYQFLLPVAPKDYYVASFINNSPTHMEQLVQELSAVCQISFIENTDILARFTSVDMVSPHFVPAFEKDCLDRMLNFFNHHFSCWKSLQYNAQMMGKVLETYPGLQGLQSDNVKVRIEADSLVVTGLKGEVDNRRQMILDAIQLRNNGQQGGGSSKNSSTSFPTNSRRSSATGSEEGNQPKAAKTSRRPRNRERSSAGGSQEIKPHYSFVQPKLKNFDKIIDYVFNTPAHIGSLSEQVGKATKIQRHPKARNPKVKFITRVEAKNALPASELRKIAQTFFKQFSCWSQSFPQEQIDQADKNSPELVDKLKDNPVSIQWNNNTAIVVGLSENVEAFSAALKKALQQDKEIEMEYSSQNALHLVKCGAVEEISKKYKDSFVILFSLGKLKFKGKESKVKEVIKEVQEMNLIDTNLEMVEEKLLLLKTALNCVEPCVYNREFVENEIEKQNLKAAIEVENDEVHLMTMTNEMSAQAVAILNNMITTHQIEIPSDISPLVKLKTLQDKLNKFTKCYVVKIKENVLELILFVGDDTKLIEEAKSYLNSCCPDSRVLEFTPGVTRFIGKYWLNDESCSLVPSSFSTKVLEQGIEFTGPPDVLDTVIEKLVNKNLDCHNFSYSSPKLSTLLEEIKWKAFVTFLEATHRCTVTAATDSAVASTKSRFNERNNALNDIAKVSEAMFGKVKVKIVVGDITEEYSDVIINGATSDFVLSRGTVSSALLKVAGPAMQDQCNNNPVMTYPAVNPSIRVTDSFNLLCNHVVHLVTPRQSSMLAAHIKDAMEVADMLKAESVSIPTLGAGGIGLDCGEIASAMCEAFAQFAESSPSCVREIRVVVYETSIVEIFKRGITVCMGLTNYLESCWLRFKHDKPQEDNLSIQIVCDDQSCLDQVKHEVEKHMKSVVVTKTISDDAIHNMSDHDRIEVFDISCDGLVNVELQQNSITLQGLDENVGKVYELVRDKLRDIKYQPTNGAWEWSFGGNKFHPLPMRVCQQLENYKNRGGVNVITLYGHSLTVTGMDCELNGIKGKLKQPDYKEQATSNDLPSSWSNMDGRSLNAFKTLHCTNNIT
nr:uncharacterized protein LOC100182562 [Ciona intestinalis]|eukprot:XP_026693896.1 uncharacterized protein LOC100182562 [Ciona intestinalis]